MSRFYEELREQRWDDHRFYHRSRINQSLHLISALCFLSTYIWIFIDPVKAVFFGWLIAWTSRQVGHFFFEPKGYDDANDIEHDDKEAIKIGYNLKRKVILLSLWIASPLALYFDPTFFGVFNAESSFLYNLSLLWIFVALGALLGRTLQLFFIRDMTTGLVWFTKILTDPFHDVKIYHKSPFKVLRGDLYDPMTEKF